MLIYHLQVGSQSKNYLVSDTEDDKWNTGVETKAQVKKKRMKQKSISSVTITKPIHTIDRSHNFCLCSSFSSHNVKNVQIQSFSCIWTEYWDLRSKYGDLRSKYLYLVQNQGPEKVQYLDTFQAVLGRPSFTPQQQQSSNQSVHVHNRTSKPQCFGCGKTEHWRRTVEPLT